MNKGVEHLAEMKIQGDRATHHLQQAQALIPQEVLTASGLEPDIQECIQDGFRHYWMENLQVIGKWQETRAQDDTLPPDFWNHLVEAADAMSFYRCIPYFMGKAERKPLRTWQDVLAAHVVIRRQLESEWRAKFPDMMQALDAYVERLAALKPEYPALFQQADTATIAQQFTADKWLELPEDNPEFVAINEGFFALFDDLFEMIHQENWPEELAEERWAIVNVNKFQITNGPGLFPYTIEEVWWRIG